MSGRWTDPRSWMRLALLLSVGGWGIVLGRPDDAFATSHSYDVMAHWMSEDHWATAFWLGGIVLFFTDTGLRPVRVLGVVPTCLLQASIAVSFGCAPEFSTGFFTYIGTAILSAWLVWAELRL